MIKSINKIIESPIAKLGVTVVGAITVILTAYFALEGLVDRRIDQRFTDIENLRRVAALVRPYVIFDQDGAVRFDGGALDLFERPPEVIKEPVSGSNAITSAVKKLLLLPKNKY